MKQLLLLLMFFLMQYSAFSQGMLSGGLEYNRQRQKDGSDFSDATHNFEALVRLGKIHNNFMWGASIGYSSTRETQDFGDLNQRFFSITPFVRHTYRFNRYLGVWNQFSVGGTFGNLNFLGPKSPARGINASYNPGIIIYINDRWSIESTIADISYTLLSIKFDDTMRTTITDTNLSVFRSITNFSVNYSF
jgi:hypothetical protein